MKVLFYINHFFGQNSLFHGKSSHPVGADSKEIQKGAMTRKKYVEQVIDQARKLGDVNVRVCGIEGYSLVPLDVSFGSIKEKPLWLIYESINHMAGFLDDYDYFVNVEDDVFLPEETFKNIIEFDKISFLNEIFLPNRLEKSSEGQYYCVDLMAISGWTQQTKNFKGKNIRVAVNPHSGVIILSKEKFRYALCHLDRNYRKSLLHNELDSAFAYFHSPFSLFRSQDLGFHSVIHLDKWYNSPGEMKDPNLWKNKVMSIGLTDFVPPIFLRLYSFLRSIISVNRT